MHSLNYHRYGMLKLTPNNYHIWKQKTQLILTKERLWHIVRDQPPAVREPEWIEKDEMASACIGLLVDDQYLVDVRDQKDAHSTWEHLSQLYGQRNMQNRMTLNKSLFTAKYKTGSDMNEHLAQMMEISSRLRDLGHPLDEPLMCSALLCSLPSEYNTLITTIEINSDTSLSIESVRSMIMEEANRHKITQEEIQSPNTALAVNTQTYRNTRSNNNECFYCHKVGHLKRDCRLRKRHESHTNLEENPKTYPKHIPYDGAAEYSKFVGICSKTSIPSDCEESCCSITNTPKAMTMKYPTHCPPSIGWIVDTGACAHLCNNPELLTNYSTDQHSKTFVTADGGVDVSVGVGEHYLQITDSKGQSIQIKLAPVFCVPRLTDNLISISALDNDGFTTHFRSGKAFIQKDNNIYLIGEKEHHLYRTISPQNEHAKTCLHLWHDILGHPNYIDLSKTIDLNKETNHQLHECHPNQNCHTCLLTKLSDNPYKTKREQQTTRPHEMLHSDIIGPITPMSIGGNTYVLSIIDDYTRYSTVYPIKNKSDATNIIKNFITKNTNRLNRPPSRIRTDGGGEFCNKDLRTFLQNRGIKHEVTVPHTPQQNGRAERYNRTLFSNVRAIIKTSKLPRYLWGELTNTANYLNNLVIRENRNITPFEAWFNKKPKYSHLHTIGTQCVYLNTNPNRRKMDDRGLEGVLVGYGESTQIYRIWDTHKGTIIHSRRVKFYDDPCIHCPSEYHNNITYPSPSENQPSQDNPNIKPEAPPDQQLRRSCRSNLGTAPKLLTYNIQGESHQTIPDWYADHDISPLGGV